MATSQAKLINSVCKNKDISVILAHNVDDLFDGYKDVWDALKSYHSRFRSVPDISVLQEKFTDLETVEVNGDSGYYLDTLKNEFIKARMERIASLMGTALQNEAPARVLQKVQVEYAKLNKYTNSVQDVDITDIDRAISRIETTRERSELMGGSPGIPTGIGFIDAAYITGMAPGHLIVNIGWPGKGKTWLAAKIACNAFAKGFKPMIFSLEMTGDNMSERIYTIMGSGLFTNSGFARGDINLDDFREFGRRNLLDKKGFTVTSPDGINEITPNVVQGKIEQYKPDLVILDYAQLFTDNRNTDAMTPRMMNLSREIKQLAVTNHIPIVLITAATAEDSSDRNEPPTLDKVAWSKSIEYDADMAYAVQYNEDSQLFEVVGRKNRHGTLFAGFLQWDIDKGIVSERFM